MDGLREELRSEGKKSAKNGMCQKECRSAESSK